MKTIKKKRYILGILALVLFLLGLKIAVLDNPNVLFAIAEGLDQPSKRYYAVQERIYSIAERKNISKEILQHLEDDKNKHLHNLYIKTLGVIGEYYSATYLIKAYARYQDDEKHALTVWYIISCMGMLGNNDAVPLLETLLKNYDKHKMQVTRYSLARSLYLITGEQYNYVNDSGEKTKLCLTNELKSVRKVIVNSKGRKRTCEEMITLDKLYRPPEKGVDYSCGEERVVDKGGRG